MRHQSHPQTEWTEVQHPETEPPGAGEGDASGWEARHPRPEPLGAGEDDGSVWGGGGMLRKGPDPVLVRTRPPALSDPEDRSKGSALSPGGPPPPDPASGPRSTSVTFSTFVFGYRPPGEHEMMFMIPASAVWISAVVAYGPGRRLRPNRQDFVPPPNRGDGGHSCGTNRFTSRRSNSSKTFHSTPPSTRAARGKWHSGPTKGWFRSDTSMLPYQRKVKLRKAELLEEGTEGNLKTLPTCPQSEQEGREI